MRRLERCVGQEAYGSGHGCLSNPTSCWILVPNFLKQICAIKRGSANQKTNWGYLVQWGKNQP